MRTFVHMCVLLNTIWVASAHAVVKTMTVDVKKSVVSWSGTFTGAKVSASLKFKSGQLVFKSSTKNTNKSSGTVVADMKSFQSDSGMDAQLKGPMMLNVEKFPTAEIKITELTELKTFAPGGPNAHIRGTVNFRGETHPVEADFVMKNEKSKIHAVGKFETAYGKMLSGTVSYDIWTK